MPKAEILYRNIRRSTGNRPYTNSVVSHKSFQTHDNLPYPLLSDSANLVLTAFGIPRQFFMTGRMTFVVDKTGKIVFTYSSAINGTRHAEEALAYLQNHPNR